MAPAQTVAHNILWLCIPSCIVPPFVLQQHRLYLCLWVRYVVTVVLQFHFHLLVCRVYGGISIGYHVQTYAHRLRERLFYHKANLYGIVAIVIVNRKQIVSRNLRTAYFVRNAEMIVRVNGICKQRLLYVVYRVAVRKAFHIVAVKERSCWFPIGFAMFQLVGIAMIFVCKVVEMNVQHAVSQFHNGHGKPVFVRYNLQRPYVFVQYFVALRYGSHRKQERQ